MDARDIIVLGILQDRDPPGGPQVAPTEDIGLTEWHLTVLRWWRPKVALDPREDVQCAVPG